MLLLLLIAMAGAETLDSDTTWSERVDLHEDLLVPEGVTLRLEPGAELHLAEGVGLTVQGRLEVLGSDEHPVLLTGLDGARWGSVLLEPGSTAHLDHCELVGGARALSVDGAEALVERCRFADNAYEPSLTAAGAALFITGDAQAVVRGRTFEDNEALGSGQGGAVFVDRASPVLQGNVFRGNTSVYGGALVTSLAYGPIVGNTFEDNAADWEGGALALISSALLLADNTITGNTAILDGAGVHVCTTCNPHANPAVLDNTITGNTNVGHGAAGLGAACLRALSGNDIHDNLGEEGPSDLAWHNANLDEEAWYHSPSLPGSWWGTTDLDTIARAVADGEDERAWAWWTSRRWPRARWPSPAPGSSPSPTRCTTRRASPCPPTSASTTRARLAAPGCASCWSTRTGRPFPGPARWSGLSSRATATPWTWARTK